MQEYLNKYTELNHILENKGINDLKKLLIPAYVTSKVFIETRKPGDTLHSKAVAFYSLYADYLSINSEIESYTDLICTGNSLSLEQLEDFLDMYCKLFEIFESFNFITKKLSSYSLHFCNTENDKHFNDFIDLDFFDKVIYTHNSPTINSNLFNDGLRNSKPENPYLSFVKISYEEASELAFEKLLQFEDITNSLFYNEIKDVSSIVERLTESSNNLSNEEGLKFKQNFKILEEYQPIIESYAEVISNKTLNSTEEATDICTDIEEFICIYQEVSSIITKFYYFIIPSMQKPNTRNLKYYAK